MSADYYKQSIAFIIQFLLANQITPIILEIPDFIRYQAWNNNYAEDLKYLYLEDGIHLNVKGYIKLDSCIIETCIKLIVDGKN